MPFLRREDFMPLSPEEREMAKRRGRAMDAQPAVMAEVRRLLAALRAKREQAQLPAEPAQEPPAEA
jgi:hypothetical protein